MSFRLFFITILAIIAIINIALNYQQVEYHFLWSKGSFPLSLITLFSMAFGALLGIVYISYIKSNIRIKKKKKSQKTDLPEKK